MESLELVMSAVSKCHCSQSTFLRNSTWGNFSCTETPSNSSCMGSLFPKLPTHFKLQLVLVIPDAVVKDARLKEVTLENYSACMALFKESEMFDYWSLFQAYRTDLQKTPDPGVLGVWSNRWYREFIAMIQLLGCLMLNQHRQWKFTQLMANPNPKQMLH